MEDLLELCGVFSTKKIRYQNLLGTNDDKADLLFQLIVDGKVSSNEDAMRAMFEDNSFPEKSLARTKERLRKRLVNSMMCAYDERESLILRTYKNLEKELFAFKILRAKGKKKAARVLGEKAIKRAIKNEFTDIVLGFARDLHRHYAIDEDNRKKYQYYANLVKTAARTFNEERIIEGHYIDVIFHLKGKKHYSGKVIELIREKAEEVNDLMETCTTFKAVLLGSNVMVYYYQLTQQIGKLVERCQRTISFFENLDYVPPYTAFFSFLYKLIPNQILLKQFDEVEQSIQKCLQLATEGSHNWIITKQYEVVMYFHQGKIREAGQIIRSMRKDYANEIKNFRETWLIYEAYAALLNGEKVRLGKFLNDVPQFSKDKRGMNINMLIIQVLVLLQRRKYGDLIDRMAALERYSYRYLKKDDTFRSNCFIHILLKLEKGDFNLIAVRRHAAKYLKALQSVPVEKSKQDIDVEVVPYELLWEKVVEILK